MSKDRNVVHRKIIVPWYDSETSCFILLFLMFLVFVFSLAGVSVAHEYTEYNTYIWVPYLLMLMSIGVSSSITVRLILRYIERMDDKYLKDFTIDSLK